MKKLILFATLAMAALLFTSCNKIDYKSFVGTWGVEKIEYYNTDYAGNPIAGSMETHIFDPDDTNNGIHMIFREDKTGELRDSALDSVQAVQDGDTVYVYCPDTIVVTRFTYSYDQSDRTLYLNLENVARPYRLQISNFIDNSFVYENEYYIDYVERAYLKRVSNTPMRSASRKAAKHPRKPGSFLGGR